MDMAALSQDEEALLDFEERSARVSNGPAPKRNLSRRSHARVKSRLYLLILVLGIGGLQIAWATELSYGSPYLQTLGMSKGTISFVWIAGPLSGTLVQPFVGMQSDRCRSSWGKRTPFIFIGAISTVTSLILLAWAREIIHCIASGFGADLASQQVWMATTLFAVVMVYILDFAINTVQAGLRSLIVDGAPYEQQEQANAYAGILTGIGNIIAYVAAENDLRKSLWFLGNTQFQILAAIACLSLVATISISLSHIKEDSSIERDRDRDSENQDSDRDSPISLAYFFRQVLTSIWQLPKEIQTVCLVQVFQWFGWFPFLFYITTYIGQLHVNQVFKNHPNLSPEDVDRHWEEGTRKGSFALLVFAIVSLSTNVLLPLVVRQSFSASNKEAQVNESLSEAEVLTYGQPFYNDSETDSTESALVDISRSQDASKEESLSMSSSIKCLTAGGLTLRRAWLLSQWIYILCMLATFVVETAAGATVLVGFVGFTWALTQWAPYALISATISQVRFQTTLESNETGYSADPDERTPLNKAKVVDRTGIILGIHNMAIAIPQLIASLVCSAIFHFFQKPRDQAGDDSTGWALRVGGVATLIAVVFTNKLSNGRQISKNGSSRGRI